MITNYANTLDVISYLAFRPDRERGGAPHSLDVLVLRLAPSVRPLPDLSWYAVMAQLVDTHLRPRFPQVDFPDSSSEETIRICPDDLRPFSEKGGLVPHLTHLQEHQQEAGTCPRHLSLTSDYGV